MRFPRLSGPRGTLIGTATAVALIAAQLAVLGHDLGVESHAPDSVCAFCIAGAGLADAPVAAVGTVVAVLGSVRVPAAAHRAGFEGLLRSHFARAPPTAS